MLSSLVCQLLLLITAYATNTYAAGIEGGTPTTIKARPYVVSIQGTDGTRTCVGALISSNTVVTAARCLAFFDSSKLVVAVNDGGQVVKIAAKTFDIRFDPITNENDVAVLKLAQSVKAGTVKLASSLPKTGTNGVVTGWDAKNKLVDMPVSVINRKDCISGKFKYSGDEVLKSMVCGLAKNNKACGAIGGSPLVANNQLVGLISWGNGCGNKGNPAVYTDIPSVSSWITKTVKNW
ncbi:trypsin [Zeugodacus cucurbitae]|uniref:Trypsin n=1 Tax=Zeugodacus cucurbitae TaxID=28588 RepID=A0A0A1XPF4_ZEUCU|nr:trypsin [Zeugodacus cucurbitae]